jgi:sugar phosphate isomerase/epimerase
MQLLLFKTLWGFDGDHGRAAAEAVAAGFDGLEGQVPEAPAARRDLQAALSRNGLEFIAEITTAGSYVPDRGASVAEHLASLEAGLARCAEMNPRRVTAIAGCDAWPEADSLRFFAAAMELAERHGLPLSFETHRSRSLFNPWVTQRLVAALPDMALTVDFSHWCVVCERLLDSELDVIDAIAPRVRHIHARVGYDQGPQVPHPAAPEYAAALAAHQRWWQRCWDAQRTRGLSVTTMTPEFGPDGYLHQLPFTAAPVADLWQINRWMGDTERAHFARFIAGSPP